jgi:hypothetical protein
VKTENMVRMDMLNRSPLRDDYQAVRVRFVREGGGAVSREDTPAFRKTHQRFTRDLVQLVERLREGA